MIATERSDKMEKTIITKSILNDTFNMAFRSANRQNKHGVLYSCLLDIIEELHKTDELYN